VTGARIAAVGLGNMGAGMALRLLDAGHPLVVHNRTVERARPLVDAGATLAATAADAVRSADLVLLSLADEAAVEQVLFGELVGALPSGAVVVDTSTVSPAYARQAARRLGEAGFRRVEACVIGNPLQARDGELRIVTAGDWADVDAVEPVLQKLAQEVTYLGEPGMAATMKLVLNLLLGAQVASFAEAISYGERAGLDRDAMLAAITRNNGFSSRVMLFRARFFAQRDYLPAAFRARLLEKDLRLAIDEAAALGLSLPVIERTAEQFHRVVASGLGDQDAAVILELQDPPPAPSATSGCVNGWAVAPAVAVSQPPAVASQPTVVASRGGRP
jgi:3-hydroxyisobutyrate dehydrogenase-like beta-hydroxyacid dehydrogenase